MRFIFEDDYWWEVKGDKVYNRYGGYHPLDKKLPIVEAIDWYDLDWSCLLRKNSDVGWIAPDGTWFGCKNMDHADVAKFFFLSSEEMLEQKGWVKVYRSGLTNTRNWYRKGMRVNNLQAKTLTNKGFELYDFDILE